MHRQTDQQLLEDYAGTRSEAAFAELVGRHVDFVYSAALRMVRDAHLAEDVTQATFIALAQNAGKLARRSILSGWLHRTAQNIAANTVRSEVRRRARESRYIGAAMSETNATESATLWDQIAPQLDAALAALNDADRDALMLRYFERKSAREMSAILGTSEEAAQKRVNRAAERLRAFFAARGVTAGAAGIIAAIGANAVHAAPPALAAAISTAAFTTTTLAAATTASKALVMTTLQKTIIGATLAAAVTTGIYQSVQTSRLKDKVRALEQQQAPLAGQLDQANRERDTALKQLARLTGRQAPRLPAPAVQTSAAPEEASANTLYSRITNYQASLKPSQLESYLKRNGRNAASLLAGYRTSRDTNLLAEAMEKYPNDPQVAFEAMFKPSSTPDERRHWLDAFKTNAPDNSLPNYLSALDHFKAGQSDDAVQELLAASGKGQFTDYTLNRMQDDEEAYLAAGYSPAESKTIPAAQLLLPQLAPMKELSRYVVDLANSYRQAGDQNSADAALQIAANLGQHYANNTAGESEISRLVGIAVESYALKAMDPNTPYGATGQTVKDRLDALLQQREGIKSIASQTEALMPSMTPEDWISYKDRWRMFGEEAAGKWLIAKYGQK